jgi:hypothetical protein
MPSIKIILTAGLIVAAVLITIIVSGILPFPSFQVSNKEKLQTISEGKQPVRFTNIVDIGNGLTKSDSLLLQIPTQQLYPY